MKRFSTIIMSLTLLMAFSCAHHKDAGQTTAPVKVEESKVPEAPAAAAAAPEEAKAPCDGECKGDCKGHCKDCKGDCKGKKCKNKKNCKMKKKKEVK